VNAGSGMARRLAVWRSPDDQPRWARPALLGLTLLAALAYGWDIGSSIEIFYAAAVRSMSMHWHDFLYGAFDPAGTITIDKLPGAFWVQALSVRLFGVHTWAVALPQVVEGALTVPVLYRAVRRLAGPLAGLAAAAVLALSPATVALDRGNISDTLMVLLVVLAADAVVSGLLYRRLGSMLLAGLWVGVAFQAKMLEAWLVLPALGLTYLVACAGPLRPRLLRLAALVGVVAVVSLSWMTFVSLTPASQRPYVDGSQHNSVFEQVFDYNGFGRVGQASPNAQVGRTLDIPFLSAPSPRPAWNRLLHGPYGRDSAWLLPAALASLVAGLVARRRQPRTDLVRAGVILWGTWLLTLGLVFSVSATINSYYLAALTPAIAGLLGIGADLAWRARQTVAAQVTVAGVTMVTALYAAWLLPAAGTGVPTWLATAAVVIAVAATGLLLVALRRRAGTALVVTASLLVGFSVVLVPALASQSLVANQLGPFDTPFQPTAFSAFTKAFFGAPLTSSVALVPKLESVRHGAPFLMAAQTSVLASTFIFATGQEVLPIGGYTGNSPAPSVRTLARMADAGDFHLVIAAEGTRDPRIAWVAKHCIHVTSPPPAGTGTNPIGPFALYYCVTGPKKAGSD
jgi:4-amino-4-deoxy-L-arabinose transferase-like glycosyltransferase